MSKHNKVNPGQYTQAGRLSPDDAAREQQKQVRAAAADRGDASMPHRPQGISNRETPQEEAEEQREHPPADGGPPPQDAARRDRGPGGGGEGWQDSEAKQNAEGERDQGR